MVLGAAKDLVPTPPDSDKFIFLARRVGYTTNNWARHLQSDIEQHMKLTHAFFERTFGHLLPDKDPPPPHEL